MRVVNVRDVMIIPHTDQREKKNETKRQSEKRRERERVGKLK